MKPYFTLVKMKNLTMLGVVALLLTGGDATAANRIFPLYLENRLSYPVTFKVVPGSCYQGTGSSDPSKLLHGPVAPGGRVKFDVASDQSGSCEDADGVFFVKTTDPRHQAGNGQSFISSNSGHLGMREGSEEFSGYLSAKSATDESYTWTILEPIPSLAPEHNRLIRIQNVTSGQYLTQAHHGQRDDVRNVTVWPLPGTPNNSFRWIMQDAGGGYWQLINLATGLALSWDGSGQNVSDWGITSGDNPNQLWRFERRRNRYMIINKATNHGLQQAHNGVHPDKRDVHIWGGQTFDGNGWAWRLEDGGFAKLRKLTLQKVKAIKTSTGQDIGTEILFGAIEAAITGGAGAAKKVGHKTLKLTAKEIVREAGKEAGKSVLDAGKAALEDRAREVSGVNDYEDTLKNELQNQNNAVGTVSGIGLDVVGAADDFAEATSLQNAFNVIYGESPDDLRINVNGVSIWPNGGRDSRKIKSQQTLGIATQTIFEKSKGLAIQLVEFDSGSPDDSLGWIGFTEEELAQTRSYKNILVRSDSEGSLYELTFTVGPIGMDAADIENYEQQNIRLTEERERKAQQAEKNRLMQAETDRKMAQAAITPFSANLKIQGSENGLSQIPVNRYGEYPEKLFISPAIYLDVTFANGSTSNAYYQLQAPDNVIFDDTSGDPDDLIKLVYTPGPDGTEIPGQITATGNGVGTAYLKVSFRNKPGLTASAAVEVVGVELKQAIVNPIADLLNGWAARQREKLTFPHTADVFQISQIYSRCPAGCEMVYASEDVLVVMGMPDYAKNELSMAQVEARVGQLFLATYCSGEGKKENAVLSFAVGDKYGARIANTTFNPVDCDVTQASPAQVAPAPASSNASAQTFNQLAEGSRAEIPLPFTAGEFEMRAIYSICPSGCESDFSETGLGVAIALPAIGASDVSGEEIHEAIAQLLGPTYCAGEVKKKNGVMWISVDDMHGSRVADIRYAPANCPIYTEQQAQAPVEQQVEFVPSQAGIVASTGPTNEVTQFALYNDLGFNWAVAWVDGNGAVTAGSQSILPGQAWRIENGASGWGWYTVYTTERYLCSFSPRQGASLNISQLSACSD